MAPIRITNKNFTPKSCLAKAGDEILLEQGTYTKPVLFEGLRGTQEKPIVIRPNPKNKKPITFTSNISFEDAKFRGNTAARQRQKAGNFPALGHVADEAMFVLKDCQFVVTYGLNFEHCWPTAVYLDNCKYVALHDLHFTGGTFAIGMDGNDTRDIVVQNCHWVQDPTDTMWKKISWLRIHGQQEVDVKEDFRHWDGDFIRGWDIAGNITIRKNTVSDAFNGIHFFNNRDRLAPGVDANSLTFNDGRKSTANFLIEDNKFTRIRDNIFEPEYHAWNWVIRSNETYDCYRPFSFEFERAAYFYIYNNKSSFNKKPTQEVRDEDRKLGTGGTNPSLFKVKDKQENEGPIYVFNNSWYMRIGKGIFSKNHIAQLIYTNNAAEFSDENKKRMFGKSGDNDRPLPPSVEAEKKEEEGRFTRRWLEFAIQMDNDIANDTNFPLKYQTLGYEIGPNAKHANPNFLEPTKGNFETKEPQAVEQAKDLKLRLPSSQSDGVTEFIFSGGHNIGSHQASNVYASLNKAFEFLPDTSWLPSLPKPRPYKPPKISKKMAPSV